MNIRFAILLALNLLFWFMLARALWYGRTAMRRMLEMEQARAIAIKDLLDRQSDIAKIVAEKLEASAHLLAAKVEASAHTMEQRLDSIDGQLAENTELTKQVAVPAAGLTISEAALQRIEDHTAAIEANTTKPTG